MSTRLHLNGDLKIKIEHGGVPVIPAMAGSLKHENHNPCWPGQQVRPYLQNNQNKSA
jgi:hypothetical protein